MRRYEEFKSTEVEWLEFIPQKWSLVRLKDLCVVETGSKNTEDKVDDGTYPFFVRSQTIEYINSYSFDGEAILTAGDGVGVAKVFHHFKGKFEAHQRVYRISGFDKVNGRFLYYYLKENLYKEVLKYNVKATVDSLRMPMFQRFPILCPSISEQQAIANYLDAKTQAIDKKISLLEQKIETYKKLKRTLINQTITKGLDKNVRLQDSGISWIGQIPQHWEVKRLKDICNSMSSGATPTSGNLSYYEDGTINWLNTGDLNDGIINSTQKKLNNSVFDDYPNLKIQKKGTLVIAMYGATIGKMGLLDIDSTTNQACCCLNLKKDNYNKFHFYQLLNLKQYIISLSVGGTQPNVSQGILSFIEMVVPPKSEQQEIAAYIDKKTATIDAIVDNISKQIETLKQLRKTLINDVVTGKIKVVE